MTDGAGPDRDPSDESDARRMDGASGAGSEDSIDVRRLAQDWITLWQSELAAIAVDREAHETWQAMLALWAGAAATMLHAIPRGRPAPQSRQSHDRTARHAKAEPAPRSPAPAAAPDPRDAEIDRLARHVAALEARLAGLERGNRGGASRQPRKRKR
jgi:hypothetical protein